jgi:hypothetical protein
VTNETINIITTYYALKSLILDSDEKDWVRSTRPYTYLFYLAARRVFVSCGARHHHCRRRFDVVVGYGGDGGRRRPFDGVVYM